MKNIILLSFILASFGCSEKRSGNHSIELISDPGRQDSIYRAVVSLISQPVIQHHQFDSLAFLILPTEASCPSCRKKTIDSLMKHRNKLAPNHFIIISAPNGIKGISAYFKEQNYPMPIITDKLFIDSNHLAYTRNLFDANPAFYYAHNGKVYKKVSAIPATVREDLREFFSGYRLDQHTKK